MGPVTHFLVSALQQSHVGQMSRGSRRKEQLQHRRMADLGTWVEEKRFERGGGGGSLEPLFKARPPSGLT